MTNTDRNAVERLAKWADGEAMAAYGDDLVDDPEDHERRIRSALTPDY